MTERTSLVRRLAISQNDALALNWLLLVIAVVCVICTLFFLFYWNRIVARALALALRLKYFKSDNVWIELESFQISFLSGRIFLKDLRYYSRNQSFRIHKCHITWRYWIWRTRDDMSDAALPPAAPPEEGAAAAAQGHTLKAQLPCRIFVYAEGVEWFLYNRTPAYDSILSRLADSLLPSTPSPAPPPTAEKPPPPPPPPDRPASPIQTFLLRTTEPLVWLRSQVPTLAFSEILPIEMHLLTGAVVLGNDSTPSLVVGSWKESLATWGVSPSRSALDIHKQVFSSTFDSVKIITRTNPDYRQPVLEQGLKTYSDALREPSIGPTPLQTPSRLLFPTFQHLFAPLLPPHRRTPTPSSPPSADDEPPTRAWKGLERFRTEGERTPGEGGGGWRGEREYAKVPGLLEARQVEVVWYSDVAGPVPEGREEKEGDAIGNGGEEQPEWGVDLVVRDAQVTYGPWADRQRQFIQSVFSPNAYADSSVTPRLKEGDTRMAVEMRFLVMLEGRTTLRIPTREISKDWKYDSPHGLLPETDTDTRAYGWIDLAVGASSSVSYVLPAITTPSGSRTSILADLRDVRISSSVNYAVFWSAQSARLSCALPSPLKWQAERTWEFDLAMRRAEVWLLRDHVYLIQDLVRDWNSGEPQEYAVFVPVRYEIRLGMEEYEVNLYANDYNVVSKPRARDDNVFLTASGPTFTAAVTIPSTHYRPPHATVPFSVALPSVSLSASFPQWSTHAAFMSERTARWAWAEEVTIDGRYEYFTSVGREFVDRLKLEVVARQPSLKLLGHIVRHVLVLRDDYFGGFTSFSTLEEYQLRRARGEVGDPVEAKWRPGRSNVFEVDVKWRVEEGRVVLPGEVHECGRGVGLEVAEIGVGIGVNEFGMELHVLMPPIRMAVVADADDWLTRRPHIDRSECVLIESLTIACNRLFGPQPRTSTYLCLWEIALGAVRGNVPLEFGPMLAAALQALEYTFPDVHNAPDPGTEASSNADVTFLKVTVAPADILLRSTHSTLQLRLPDGVLIDYTDLPRPTHGRTLSVLFGISVRALVPAETHQGVWYEAASLVTSVRGEVYLAGEGWRRKAERQVAFVREQDRGTRRAAFVYAPELEGEKFQAWRKHGLYFLTRPRRTDETNGAWKAVRDSYAYAFTTTDASDESDTSRENDRVSRSSHYLAMPTPTGTYFDAQDIIERNLTSSPDTDDEQSGFDSAIESSESGSRDSGPRDSWNGTDSAPHTILKPFKLHKDPAESLVTIVPIEQWGNFPPLLPRNHWAPEALLDNVDRPSLHAASNTTVVINLCDPVQVFFTPQITQCMEDFISTIDASVWSPERELDILMLDHISKSKPKGSPSSTVLQLQVDSIAIRSLQLVRMPTVEDNRHGRDHNRQDSQMSTSLEVLAICDVSVGASSLLIANVEGAITVADSAKISVPRLCLWRSTADDWAKSARDPSSLSSRLSYPIEFAQVLEFESDGIVPIGSMSPGSSTHDVSILPVKLRLVDTALATARATITVLGQILERMSNLQTQSRRLTQSRARFLVWNVLQYAEEREITTDPAFLNLTTFLVQLGRPRERRADPGWRILSHVRHCLRLLPVTNRDHLARTLNSDIVLSDDSTERAMYAEVMGALKKWRSWEIELSAPHVQSLLRTLFPTAADPETTSGDPRSSFLMSSNFLDIKVEQLSLVLVGIGVPDDVILRLGPLSLKTLTCVQTAVAPTPPSETESTVEPTSRSLVLHAALDLTMDYIEVQLSPNLLPVFQRMLRLRRLAPERNSKRASTPPSAPAKSVGTSDGSALLPSNINGFLLDVTSSLRMLTVQAAAQKITFDLVSKRFTCLSMVRLERDSPITPFKSIESSTTLANDDFTFRARLAHGSQRLFSSSRDLAWVSFVKSSLTLGVRTDQAGSLPSGRATLIFKRIGFNVPHSAVRLYKFVDEWRAAYLPVYEAMLQGILAELRPTTPTAHERRPKSVWMDLSQVQVGANLAIDTIAINLRVLPSTWLSWEYHGTFAFLATGHTVSESSHSFDGLHYGLRLRSQTIRLVQANASFDEGLPASAPLILVNLPSFHCSGDFSEGRIRSLAIVDHFKIPLNAQIFDDVLVIPSKFGKDVNEILDLISESRQARTANPSASELSQRGPRAALLYSLRVILRGFEIGIEGPVSTQFVDAVKVEGNIDNQGDMALSWDFSVTDLTLSLAHSTSQMPGNTSRKNRYRSAYMAIDLEASNRPPAEAFGEKDLGSNSVSLIVSKIHAVLQAAAIGELGDLVDYYQGEMLLRKDQRATEIEAIRAQTQRVRQTFEVEDKPRSSSEPSSLFGSRFTYFSICEVGVAIPLTLNEVALPSMDTHDSTPIPVSSAFLATIDSITFMSEPNSTGSAGLKDLAFQFVSRFDQGDVHHFRASSHQTQNQMCFPDMKVDIRSQISTKSRRVRLLASMPGFELDLDPTIALYIFSLIDVYQQGQQRLHRIAQPIRSDLPSSPSPLPKTASSSEDRKDSDTSLPGADLKASFEFLSATVRLHPPSSQTAKTNSNRPKQFSFFRAGLGIDGVSVSSAGTASAEIFKLPGLSAWFEYSGPVLAKEGSLVVTQPALLLLSAVVHPSQNTLKPSLLPFITDLARNIEQRMHKVTAAASPAAELPSPSTFRPSAPETVETLTVGGLATMQINFSLRIDHSTLRMTCQPHVNVGAELNWESGGFLITVSPGAREVSFIASVAGISGGLRHGYLTENCLHASAQDLAVSAAFRPKRAADGRLLNVISLVIKTEVSGNVRFARLQDLLCFKAVWLDSIPVVDAPRRPDAVVPDQKAATTSSPSPLLVTCLLIELRNLQFEADLGQSITRMDLRVGSLRLRTRLAPDHSELSFNISEIEILADRTISGKARISHLSFDTRLRQKVFGAQQGAPRMLDVRIESGEIEMGLSTDSKKILQFHASPIIALVYDDWSNVAGHSSSAGSTQVINVHFSVKADTLEAVATILTLPRMIAIFNRLQALLAAQREGAARESEAFRAAHSTKPNNPLSDVAAAMLQSARSRFREEGDDKTVAVIQNLMLEADNIRLAVFPRSTSDQDMVRFEGRKVSAQLTRNVLEDGRYHRNLDMHLSLFIIQRLQPRPLTPDEFRDVTASAWFDLLKVASDVTIFNAPPTRVAMESWEDPNAMRLEYYFNMTYSAIRDKSNPVATGEGSVFVALNYGLLKWLGALTQNFQEELDKVATKGLSEVSEWPMTPASPVRGNAQGTPATIIVGPSSPGPSRPTTPPPPADSRSTSPQPLKMTYHKLNPGSIELPQLVQLGDITPRSNQLTLVGLRLDSVPKWVHEGATVPLEGIMKVLLEVYSHQLRRISRESAA